MIRNKLDILIADDDPEDIELIEEAILNIDPDVRFFKFFDGHSAIEYLYSSNDNELPSLIILDYNMPELKGSEVLSFIHSEKRYDAIPKVILSTSGANMHKNECINNGASEFFVKPNSMLGMESLAKKLLAYCKGNI